MGLTVKTKDEGDLYFRNKQYQLAANKYADCLRIENGSMTSSFIKGGRLHAILHCNRAACFMALQKNHEASKECTHALRICNKYLKALLRRARCNARLDMFQEALDDYSSWLKLLGKHHGKCSFDKTS